MIWSTFSGIGGLELGLEMAGLGPVVLQCEWEPWNRALLAQRWPGCIQHDDIHTLQAHHGPRPRIICGGFPCQDISSAGARVGLAGAKSGLWWELARVIAATRPEYIVLENVAAILSDSQPVVPPRAEWLGDPPTEPLHGAFGAVLWTLAALGYDATWDCVPAGALGGPHRRDRWFLVAYSVRDESQRRGAARGLASSQKARSEEGAQREWIRYTPGCSGAGLAYSTGGGLRDGQRAQSVQPREPRLDPGGIWRRALNIARAKAPWTYQPRVGGASDGLPGGVDWPTPRAIEWQNGGWQRANGRVYETLSGSVGTAKMPRPPKARPVQPWERGEPRTKPPEPDWKQRLRALGNAVVPVAGMVPGLVVRELMERRG